MIVTALVMLGLLLLIAFTFDIMVGEMVLPLLDEEWERSSIGACAFFGCTAACVAYIWLAQSIFD